MNSNGTLAPYQGYETDVLADKATAYVERSAGGAQPFFMYLAPRNPHVSQNPAPRHLNLFPGVKAPRTPSFNEADVSDKPAYIRNLAPLTAGQIADIDALYRERLQQMMAVEDMLKRLFATLQASGELENTYIFYGSDNGHFLGQHRIQSGKWSPYEEASRVPLIVRGPGVPAGRTLEHMVLNNDFAPTVADLAGAIAPDFVDGRSLAPLLTGTTPPPASWRSAFLEEGRHGLSNQFRAVRTEDYLYVENGTNAGERELYDLRADPYQLENEYATADPTLVARLQERLGALRDCAAAACHAAEVDAPPPEPGAPSVDLADASDTGASGTDNLTKDATPTFDGTAEAGSTVSVFDGATLLGRTTADAAGDWSYTATALDDGDHSITATATDAAGNASPASAPLVVKIDTAAPTADPPAESLVPNSTLGTSQVPVKAAWSATDAGGGAVASYQLQLSVGGGAYADVVLPSPTTTSVTGPLEPGRAYRLRVRAEDGAGNLGAWAEGPSFTPDALQESNAAVAYAGAWATQSVAGAYGGALRYASAAGARATLSFAGKEVAWVAPKGANRGKAEVWVDGAKAATVDLYSASNLSRRVVFTKTWAASGSHKLEVRVLGAKRAASSGTRVDVDAFVVLR
jgi:hypothetical protein